VPGWDEVARAPGEACEPGQTVAPGLGAGGVGGAGRQGAQDADGAGRPGHSPTIGYQRWPATMVPGWASGRAVPTVKGSSDYFVGRQSSGSSM
jgi:hypothetical protein